MKNFTGYEWLLIDIANQFGHDKLTFELRIEWAEKNLDVLESLADQAEAKTKPLYLKAVSALRKAQQGIPSGHMVGVDACCSGIQIMSALTGCVAGARATGMIDPGMRADAYAETTTVMSGILGGAVDITRKQAKDALMTSFYGSKLTPKNIFGEGTPELDAFYQAATTVAPGAWELLQDLLASWQPYALSHDWQLPDGFEAKVKVMNKREVRLEVDELDHATFTYEFFNNEGKKSGLSNVANLTHSVDAYILREMVRRCNYDLNHVQYVDECVESKIIHRSMYGQPTQLDVDEFMTKEVAYYIAQYERSTVVSTVILPHLDQATVTCLSAQHLKALAGIVTKMLEHKPFPLVTVHDEFRSHANNVNQVRWHYREIMAEIAESEVLDDLLSQLHGVPGSFQKLSFNLADQIRKSEYALC